MRVHGIARRTLFDPMQDELSGPHLTQKDDSQIPWTTERSDD